MENNVNSQGENLEGLKNMFADFQKKQAVTKKKTSEEILSKYFVPRKDKETFRIVATKGRNPIQEAFFHVIDTNTPGGNIKHGSVIYCPAHNDAKVVKMAVKLDENKKPVLDENLVPILEPVLDANLRPVLVPAPCPLCDKYKNLIATQDPSIKFKKKDAMTKAELVIKEANDKIYKEAIKWEAKKFYIVKGIDKGVEKDGLKFWRFKHNFKKTGTLDKLMPVLSNFIDEYQTSFADPQRGCDLNITMDDTEFNGRTYKQITAIIAKKPSVLHNDPVVLQSWVDEEISWREVFLPKRAPNTTPLQWLELAAKGDSPYWDDSDANNKHWVFPNNPELEILANTRTANLDNEDAEFEQASDLGDGEFIPVTISNVTASNVGTYVDNAVDLGSQIVIETAPATVTAPVAETQTPVAESNAKNYDNLPF